MTDESITNTAKPPSKDEQNAVQNRGISEHGDVCDSNTYHRQTESRLGLSDARPKVAPSQTIHNAMEIDSVGNPSGSLIEESDIVSPSDEPALAETACSADVTMEIPDSSQVSLLSSSYEERDMTSNAGHTSGHHSANLPAVTEDAQEEQTKGQSGYGEPIQDTSESESQIDPHSSSQLDIAQQSLSPTPKLTEPPKDKRIAALEARKTSLEATLAHLTATRDSLSEQLSALPSISPTLEYLNGSITGEGLPHVPASPFPSNHSSSPPSSQVSDPIHSDAAVLAAAKAVIKRHITLLHDYNEIRDVGLGLMGLIADARGVRIKDVQEEFGIEAKD
ncbi:hypothetical protein W97_05264 [Coniosporium apollinis CBS 100218]|uniref:Swi5-domain-containing protein n=1 Tax=Coniosporium apollinis (strain CBS 100218) TaxID=1168221 RepID=R7YWH7_CONA1|nr:uncharacterized protein W97_05264 [Coniosporium apollinis CBS 100218]EON66021.1 hypothetical protein W97_05264 [Coniosporium apollinis CBS 100218]